jgi:hypothetical protein
VEWGVVGAFAVLGSVVPGLYAHATLHADIRKRVTKALAASANIPEACDLLGKQAVSRKRLTWVAAGHAIIATAAALAYWVFPQGTEPPAAQPTQSHAASWNTPSPTLAAASRAIPHQPDSTPPSVQAAAVAAPAAEDAPAAPTLQETAPQPTANPSDPKLANKPRDTAKDTAKDKDKAKSVSNATEKTAEKAAEQARPPKPAEKAKETPAAKNPTQPPAASKNTPTAKASEPSRSKPAAPAKSTAATPQPQGQATPASETNADTASAVGTSPGFYINVGLFADESNARKAQSRLLNEGLPAFRQTLDSAKGARTRVRVGPFASRAQAESAASAIRALELDAVIFRK